MMLLSHKLWVIASFNGDFTTTWGDEVYTTKREAQAALPAVIEQAMEEMQISRKEAKQDYYVETLHEIIGNLSDR